MWGKKYRFGRKKAIYLSSTTTRPCSLFTAYADIDLAVRGMKGYLRYSALLHYIADLWFLMLCTYNLEIDLESGIHLHTVVFHLHCAVLVALIVA